MMRNILVFTVAAALTAGFVFAEEPQESSTDILKELRSYQAEARDGDVSDEAGPSESAEPAPAAQVEPAVVEAVSIETQTVDPVAVAPAGAPEEAAMEAVDTGAMLKESQTLYVGGEFELARQGFEEIIQIEPENKIARMYLRKLLERDARRTETAAMQAVAEGWKSDMVLRSYTLSGDAAEKLSLGNEKSPVNIKPDFPEVPFPEGSSAIYYPKQSKMYVRNTRENLTVLEAMLDEINAVVLSANVDQVEIEAKFVEVSEGTLEELGFQWNFADPNGVSAGGTDLDVSDGPNGLFSEALRASPSSSSPGLPFSRPNSVGREDFPNAEEWNAFRFEDTFNTRPDFLSLEYRGSDPFDLLISALDQSTGADVLSAPRVVTESGETASIQVGQVHYFPEVFEVGGNEGTIVHVQYMDFGEQLLGVELNVTPQVVGNKIEMSLNPRVRELVGWQRHTVAPADSAYTFWQDALTLEFDHDEIIGRLPIYKTREINTAITIADGGTIGMGGLISEKVESFEDKVPVLGSIPLVGRLFRNEGERAIKRNLMMFVTARKVQPSGRISAMRSFE